MSESGTSPVTEMSKRRRYRCPHCGSERTARTVYGYPSAETMEAYERGEVHLGGCVVSGDDPPSGCNDCRAGFWPRSGRYRVDRTGVRVDGLTVRQGRLLVGRVEWLDGRHLWVTAGDGVLLIPDDMFLVDEFIWSRVLDEGESVAERIESYGFEMDLASTPDGWEMGYGAGRTDPPLIWATADWLRECGGVAPMAADLRASRMKHLFEPKSSGRIG